MNRMLILSCLFLAIFSSNAASIVAPEGLSYRIDKYLFDANQDPVVLRRDRAVYVRAIGNGNEALIEWRVSNIPAPSLQDLDTVSNSIAVLSAPTSSLKRVNGKYELKTPSELAAEAAASPEGIRKSKQDAVKASLRAELTSAGFTNVSYTLDEVQAWLDTATLATGPEKKINKLISQLTALSQPSIKITP